MNIERYVENLGVPDIKLDGLQIWIHNREFPTSEDYWDSNWLNTTVHCGANNASVWVNGSILLNIEISDWLDSLVKMNEQLSGEANLETLEQQLSVRLKAEQLGGVSMEVEITPDQLTQRHYFEFEIDQSYLNSLIESCRKVLQKFPIKGNSEK